MRYLRNLPIMVILLANTSCHNDLQCSAMKQQRIQCVVHEPELRKSWLSMALRSMRHFGYLSLTDADVGEYLVPQQSPTPFASYALILSWLSIEPKSQGHPQCGS
jgi:hypothetical protein